MLRTAIGTAILFFAAAILAGRRAPAPTAERPRALLPNPSRRRIHPDQTGAGVADRWDMEGDASLVHAATI